MNRATLRLLSVFGSAMALGACAGPTWQKTPHDRLFQRVPAPQSHPIIERSEPLDGWYAIDQVLARPLARAVNPGHYVERMFGGRPALDVNHFGQVLDSTWFTNRIGRHPLSAQQVRVGPNRTGGPAPGPLLVIGGKVEGATPGLIIRDSAGTEFIVKFDPPAFPGLASGAELIATKILWAAGYNVPENYVVTFDLQRLTLDPTAKTQGPHGDEIALSRKRLDDLIALVNPYPDGSIRALFSKRLPGRVLGPFTYRGQRPDDPNDHIPHEHRRSLRGLWLFAAWLNNTDTRRANTMDIFVSPKAPDLGHVVHYLLDFGDALGAAGTKPKFPGQGYEYRLDWPLIGQSFFSLGLAYRYWVTLQRSPFRSVGLFEAQVFDPDRWAPTFPNPAFDEANAHDTYWAASIIARFTPRQLLAIVEEADYTEPGARQWVLRVLLARQYRLLARAFENLLPLDFPVTRGGVLQLTDLAVQANLLLQPHLVSYEWHAVDEDGQTLGRGQTPTPQVNLATIARRLKAARPRAPFMTVHWRRKDGLAISPPPEVRVHVRAVEGGVLAVGLDRDVH